MNYKLVRPGAARGTLRVPASKSLTHRAYILAALSGAPCLVRQPLRSDDTDITFAALQSLGYEAVWEEGGARFTGNRIAPEQTPVELRVGHSGTSARLLAAVAAIQPFPVRLDGSERMRERPMRELVEPLEQLGASVRHNDGFLPITFERPALRGGRVRLDASKSSQFLSALLLIAPLLEGETTIELCGALSSRSYADMTVAEMRKAGVRAEEAEQNENVYRVRGGQRYAGGEKSPEGDFSSASYPLAAAALTGGDVAVSNLPADSAQGDRAIADILRAFGAEVLQTPTQTRVRGTGALRGVQADMNSCPDIVPTAAVVAMFADSPSVFRNVEHLRYKESDRIAALIGNIERLGGKARCEADALVVEPCGGALRSARLPTFDDHRIAMAFALAGLRAPGVEIENPECVAKSYPDFWRDFEALVAS